MRRQPEFRLQRQAFIGKVGPTGLRLGLAQEGGALPQLVLPLAPGQEIDAERRDALGQGLGILGRIRNRERSFRQRKRPVATHRPDAQRTRRAVEARLLALRYGEGGEAVGGERRDLDFADRGGGHDTGLLGCAGHLRNDDIGLAREALRRLQRAAAAIGEKILAGARCAGLGDPVRVGEGEQEAG